MTFGAVLRESSAGELPIVALHYAAGSLLPAHRHGDPYISVLVEGAYTELCGATPRRCGAGTVIAHRADEEHADFFSTDAVCVNIHGIADGRSAAAKHAVALALAARRPRDWREAFELIEDSAGRSIDNVAPALPRPPVWLERVVRHFDWAGTVTLKEAAHDAGVHPAHLTRAFRRYLGTTPGEHRRRARIVAASTHLLGGTAPLADVAAETGFYDQSDFTNRFAAATGLSPGRFRTIFRR